jgi:hypothetical protein
MAKDANGNDIPDNKATGADSQGKEEQIPKFRFDEVIAERNQMREALQKLEKSVADQQATQKQAQEKALAEQGQFKELHAQAQAEVARLTATEKKYQEYLGLVAERNKTRRESLPENLRDLVPAFDDPIKEEDYLVKFESKLPDLQRQPGVPPAGPRPGGSGGNQDELRQIDEELKTLAGVFGDNALHRRIVLSERRQALMGVKHPQATTQKL